MTVQNELIKWIILAELTRWEKWNPGALNFFCEQIARLSVAEDETAFTYELIEMCFIFTQKKNINLQK